MTSTEKADASPPAAAISAVVRAAFCKLSGMVTEADWTAWRPADLAPYAGKVLAWFGPERCMFGSDWPVCLLAGSYGQVMGAFEAVLTGLDDAARARVLGGTAVEFYRLG